MLDPIWMAAHSLRLALTLGGSCILPFPWWSLWAVQVCMMFSKTVASSLSYTGAEWKEAEKTLPTVLKQDEALLQWVLVAPVTSFSQQC